jgi:dTDP-4-amino-4,6-dideoxygalactose transaminase
VSSNLPVMLGGDPVRTPGTFRRTPEVGERERRFIGAQVAAGEWEPDASVGGEPLAPGLSLPPRVLEALGWEQAALAAEFAAMQSPHQALHVVPADNGTHVIRIVLAALTKAGPALSLPVPQVGHEVLVPALTWQATAVAALRRNLVPKLVDVLPGTLCIDPAAAEAAITDRTVAIIPVHLYNRMADMDALARLASRHGLALIEDCAHAHGAVWRGRGAGTIGTAGTFSLQGSKTLSAQEGGLVTTLSAELADQVISLVTCGRQVGRSQMLQGDNDRMAGVVAALARAQAGRFHGQHLVRVEAAVALDRIAADLPGIRPLDSQPQVDVPPTYKWPCYVDSTEFAGMSVDVFRRALEAELLCEVAQIYAPLTMSPVYQPNSDPALNINSEFWKAIDPGNYPAPVAERAYDSVVAIEHAALLDPDFPDHFATAVHKIQAHATRLVREVGENG